MNDGNAIHVDKDLQIAALERKLADVTIAAARWEAAALDFRQQFLQATAADEPTEGLEVVEEDGS